MAADRGSFNRWAGALLVAALLLLAGPALALGLGQIKVKSQPGEPLLAEIPVVAGDPSELERLQVRFASPDTFRRVGLEPPDVAGTGLQLSVAVDAAGRPVIRVTSNVPLQQPVLSFLVEVDWGSGRLVREYTAVLDGPSAIAAPAQQVSAPTVSQPNAIPRRPAPAPEPLPPAAPVQPEAPPPPPAQPAPAKPAPAKPAPAKPAPAKPAPARPAPAAPTPRPSPVVVPTAAPEADQAYTVRQGDTLSEITVRMPRGEHSLEQAMIALLRSNPGAFIGGNINGLRAGAVLRMPPAGELSRYSAGEAADLVREQVGQWRAARAATQVQPELAASPPAPEPQPQPEAASEPARADVPARADPPAPAAGVASGEARLEIVPPSADGEAGSGSGIQAGGEGEMLRQAQESEAVAARDAEIGELRARIAELEKIQRQQQTLIELKDSALASSHDELAASQQQQGTAPQGGGWWIVGGLLLVLLAVAAWLVLRKRAAPRPRLFGEYPPRSGPQ